MVKLHQTPSAWGQEMSEAGVQADMKSSVKDLADAMTAVMVGTRRVVDFTSLDPPRGRACDGVFWDAIEAGIKGMSGGQEKKMVRFLFGFPPDPVGKRQNHHARFKAKLAKLIKELDEPPIVVMGVYARLGAAGYFNHAKIVASDAGRAVVGGHNLYDADYNQYPPVHDVSVEVLGPSALDAQRFAGYLWEYGGISNPSASITGSKNPFSQQGLLGAMSNTQTTLEAWLLDEKGGWNAISQTDFNQLPTPQPPLPLPSFPSQAGFHKATILTVGRMGGWTHKLPRCENASDYMKDYLIEKATTSIKIAHQDLIAMELSPQIGILERTEHTICKQLAAALHRASNLQVEVVVSAPYGSGKMDVYTNVPNGPQTAANYIMYYARSYFSSASNLIPLWKRLLVAPFHFTDDTPRQGHYFWPNSDGVVVCEGALANAGMPKSVGNHSKIMMVDNTTLVVGSDNHYPSPLAEVNFVIEGAFVDHFSQTYWDQLWHYSQPHAVQQWSRTSALGAE